MNLQADPHPPTHPPTHPPKQTNKQTNKHTDAHRRTQTHTDTDTHTHTQTERQKSYPMNSNNQQPRPRVHWDAVPTPMEEIFATTNMSGHSNWWPVSAYDMWGGGGGIESKPRCWTSRPSTAERQGLNRTSHRKFTEHKNLKTQHRAWGMLFYSSIEDA